MSSVCKVVEHLFLNSGEQELIIALPHCNKNQECLNKMQRASYGNKSVYCCNVFCGSDDVQGENYDLYHNSEINEVKFDIMKQTYCSFPYLLD